MPLTPTTFSSASIQERRDLQRLLRAHIGVVAPETLVISEEFGEWDGSRRRIDLLALDKDANLVVIELKRNEDGGHMELQAIRYAAMVSAMTFDQAVDIFGRYLKNLGKADQDPRESILKFLEWQDGTDDMFAQSVRIVLVSADFSKEVTSSVLWLNSYNIDIRCVRLMPYSLDGRVLVDVQQIIPLPEAVDYIVGIQKKAEKERLARQSNIDRTRYDVRIGTEVQRAMGKGRAILFVCRYLCQHGIRPGDIAALLDWRAKNVWYSLDGALDADAFRARASDKTEPGGPKFDPIRWFCKKDEEICHFGDKTYALSSQWGGDDWGKAMTLLRDHYNQFDISFEPASWA
jgi:hypothetical protein